MKHLFLIFGTCLLLGCEQEYSCAEAAQYMAQCTGTPVSPAPVCEPGEAEMILETDCMILASGGGKSDGWWADFLCRNQLQDKSYCSPDVPGGTTALPPVGSEKVEFLDHIPGFEGLALYKGKTGWTSRVTVALFHHGSNPNCYGSDCMHPVVDPGGKYSDEEIGQRVTDYVFMAGLKTDDMVHFMHNGQKYTFHYLYLNRQTTPIQMETEIIPNWVVSDTGNPFPQRQSNETVLAQAELDDSGDIAFTYANTRYVLHLEGKNFDGGSFVNASVTRCNGQCIGEKERSQASVFERTRIAAMSQVELMGGLFLEVGKIVTGQAVRVTVYSGPDYNSEELSDI